MVIKHVKRHLDFHMDFIKLHLRNRRKVARCPLCEKKLSEIKTIVFCKKCDAKFMKYKEKKKKSIINKLTSIHSKKSCFLCKERLTRPEDRMIYCVNCDISFHL
ncbi:MAG: hypothetical protein JW700_01550 [Candidatus Aenigmarchaeota archaeon]|nr:hypothetical protein [Candidatus Aenigmarchaeota archaeon]